METALDECVVANSSMTSGGSATKKMYQFSLFLMLLSFVAFVVNSVLLFVGHVYTRNKSPVLSMSLNLAATDTLASLFVGLGFVVNSYLPQVHDIVTNPCYALVFEIFRTSSLIASALHLLALAFIHYRGTVNPLHYRNISIWSFSVTHSILVITIGCWLIPATVLTVYYFSVPCQGFQAVNLECPIRFFSESKYRLFILSIFAIPLMIMFSLYTKIFLIIRKSHYCRSRGQFYSYSSENSTFNSSVRTNIIPLQTHPRASRLPSDHRSTIVEVDSKKDSSGDLSPFNPLNRSVPSTKIFTPTTMTMTMTMTTTTTTTTDPDSVGLDGCNMSTRTSPESARKNLRNNYVVNSQRKTLCTTLSIVGTYIFFYMPSVVFLGLTCVDGCPFPLTTIPDEYKFFLGFSVNLLIVSKAIFDPFIYLFRVKEVREGLARLFTCSRR